MFNKKPLRLPAPSFTCAASKHGKTLAKPTGSVSSYPFWNPNAHLVTTLTVDMDFPDSETRLSVCCQANVVPEPDYYIVNDAKGTLQASWMISPFPSYLLRNDSSVGWLYSRVLESLRIHLHGDPCFTDSRRRNPYFCKGSQRVMTSESIGRHRLTDIQDWLVSHDSFNDGVHDLQSRRLVASAYRMAGLESCGDKVDTGRSYHSGERNNAVFRAAVKAARNGADVGMAARSVHCTPPLPASEISSCVKSAIRCASRDFRAASASRSTTSDVSSMVSLQCSRWGKVGGNANTPEQVRSRRNNLQRGRTMTSIRHVMVRDRVMAYLRTYGNAGLRFLSVGGSFSGHTISLLASRVGCSRQTVYRCLKEIFSMIVEFGIGGFLDGFHSMSSMRGRVAGIAVLLASCMGLEAFGHYLDVHGSSLSNWNDIGLSCGVVVSGSRLASWEGSDIR